jgi:NAD(P)-dependent dehydrogenase (short-subunit alcohol dehydrogenase family)
MVLEGKVVIVVGVGDGLGSEVVRLCVRDGAQVLAVARSEEKLAAICQEIDPSGDNVSPCPGDVTQPDSCQAFAQAAVDRFGGLDAVVNVAALDTLFGDYLSTPDDDWRNAFDVNVVGTAHIVRAVAPHMKARGGGSIVMVGTQSMWQPAHVHQIAYATSKGALISAMYHFAEELGPDKIRCNMVIPTWMWGPPVQAYVKWQSKERSLSDEEVIKEITDGMPLREIPADEDVAEAIVFFCSDRSRFVTGETLMVNSGELMR